MDETYNGLISTFINVLGEFYKIKEGKKIIEKYLREDVANYTGYSGVHYDNLYNFCEPLTYLFFSN